MKRPKKPRVARVPIHGDAEYNVGFLIAIGGLVINWANGESVFMAMLRILLPQDQQSAMIVWHSLRTSQAKLELVHRLCRERLATDDIRVKDPDLLEDIRDAISQFKGFTRTRNFYCHALYSYDGMRLVSAIGATAPQEGSPLVFHKKALDLAAVNEIADTSTKLVEFSPRLWALQRRLELALATQLVDQPRPPLGRKSNPSGRRRPGKG